MPRQSQPPPGWTQELEALIQDCAAEGDDWTDLEEFDLSPTLRSYASSRLFAHKRAHQRRSISRSISPKPATTMSNTSKRSTSSNGDAQDLAMQSLMSSFKGLLKGFGSHLKYPVIIGTKNPDRIICKPIPNIAIQDGMTTTALLVIIIAASMMDLDIEATLVDALTLGDDKVPTKAIVLKSNSNHGLIKNNIDTIKKLCKERAGIDLSEKNDPISIGLGEVVSELREGDGKESKLLVLPPPRTFAKAGSARDAQPKLEYHTGYFNGSASDGKKLKKIAIPLSNEKGKVKEQKLMLAYLIPIAGTENHVNLTSPAGSVGDDAEVFWQTAVADEEIEDAPNFAASVDDYLDHANREERSADEGVPAGPSILVAVAQQLKEVAKRSEDLSRRELSVKKAEEDVANEAFLLNFERKLVEEKELAADERLLGAMEKEVEVEDKARHVEELKIDAARKSDEMNQEKHAHHLQLEADKLILNEGKALLDEQQRLMLQERFVIQHEKSILEVERSNIVKEKESTTAATTAVAAATAAITTTLAAAAAEKNREEAISLQLAEAESLEMKVCAAEQKKYEVEEYEEFLSSPALLMQGSTSAITAAAIEQTENPNLEKAIIMRSTRSIVSEEAQEISIASSPKRKKKPAFTSKSTTFASKSTPSPKTEVKRKLMERHTVMVQRLKKKSKEQSANKRRESEEMSE